MYEHVIKRPDGVKVCIRVMRNSSATFYVDNIGVIPKGKRKSVYVLDQFSDYRYRRLPLNERENYKLQKFLEVATLEELNQALEAAWLSIKPQPLVSKV